MSSMRLMVSCVFGLCFFSFFNQEEEAKRMEFYFHLRLYLICQWATMSGCLCGCLIAVMGALICLLAPAFSSFYDVRVGLERLSFVESAYTCIFHPITS